MNCGLCGNPEGDHHICYDRPPSPRPADHIKLIAWLSAVVVGAALIACRALCGATLEGAFYFASIFGAVGWANFIMVLIFPPKRREP